MQVVHSVELGVPAGTLYSLDMNLSGLYVMYSVKVQMQCHCDGCQVIIGSSLSLGGSADGGGGIGLRGTCLGGSLDCTADNCSEQLQDEDEDHQERDNHKETKSCHHPHM